jgi:hypothetical protein
VVIDRALEMLFTSAMSGSRRTVRRVIQGFAGASKNGTVAKDCLMMNLDTHLDRLKSRPA